MSELLINQMNAKQPRMVQKDAQLWSAAQSLEANFLAEMLKSSGFGESRDMLGGGVGEDQFSSFLVNEYATATVTSGGIGLAESLYESLVQSGGEKS
ncbi:MAG: chemotaxis protein chel [Silicimonas sp.]|nr:chemotaxis protein chel [Silicimonas sp.]